MKLPAKGDPRRPLHLAIRSVRMLGIMFIGISCLVLLPMAMRWSRIRSWAYIAVMVSTVAFYLAPGVVYVILSIFLRRRHSWAIITGLVLASLHALMAVGGMIMLLINYPARDPPADLIVATVVISFIFLAMVQLIYHLAGSFEAIKHENPGEEVRGFVPIMKDST